MEPTVFVESRGGGALVLPSVLAVTDEILASPMLRDPEFAAEVEWWVDYWESRASGWFPVYLERMAQYVAEVDSMLAAEDLPGSLRYLPVIESGYNPSAVSSARAVGMWQFMAGTAQGLGMEVTTLVDERRDPLKSTSAALRFLGELREDLGSWFLALAAYNSGPNRVRRILNQHAPLTPPSDSLFWAVRRYLPRETRDFLPKFFGAVAVAGTPQAYGYQPRDPLRFVFDMVEVPDATTLDVVARAAEVPDADIVELNPQVVRGITPPGRTVSLRVPEGQGEVFAANYARIPPRERVSFVQHVVTGGETLSHIAVQYGIRVSDLEAANPGVRARYLRIGARLTVPVAPSVRSAG